MNFDWSYSGIFSFSWSFLRLHLSICSLVQIGPHFKSATGSGKVPLALQDNSVRLDTPKYFESSACPSSFIAFLRTSLVDATCSDSTLPVKQIPFFSIEYVVSWTEKQSSRRENPQHGAEDPHSDAAAVHGSCPARWKAGCEGGIAACQGP